MRRSLTAVAILLALGAAALVLVFPSDERPRDPSSSAALTREDRAHVDDRRSPPDDDSGVDAPGVAPFARDVRARVVDSRGRPLAGARVVSSTAADSGGPDPELDASDGTFIRVPLVGEGEWVLRARAPGHATSARTVVIDGDGIPADITFVLPTGFTLRGKVRRPDGTPLPGTIVRSWPKDVHDPPHGVAVAAADGEYVLSGLPAGGARLMAEEPGAWSASVGTVVVPTISEYDVVLAPSAIVEGLVTTGPEREPVVGVEIEISQVGSNPSKPRARTDADGRYRIEGVPPNRGLQARCVTPGWGQSRGVDWGLRPNPGATVRADLHLVRHRASLRFLIRDGEGEPVSAVTVRLLPNAYGVTPRRDGPGEVIFEGLPPGDYVGVPEAPGWIAPAPLDEVRLDSDGYLLRQFVERVTAGGRGVHLEADASAEFVLVMRRGATVRGSVVDESGAPIEGATVRPADGARGVSCVTDAAGRFELVGVRPGPDVVIAAEWRLLAGRSSPVAFAAGQPTVGIAISLGAPLVVVGRIVAASRVPLRDAAVRIATTDPNDRVDADEWARAPLHAVAADGTFEVMLRADTRWVRARGEALDRAPQQTVVRAVDGERRIDVGTVELDEMVVLRGHVVDADDGRPLAEATIEGAGRALSAITTTDGRFSVRVVPSDKYDLNVSREGYNSAYQYGDLRGRDVEFRLRVLHEQSVRVIDASGAPLSGVVVGITSDSVAASASRAESRRTDTDGRVLFHRSAGAASVSVAPQINGFAALRVAAVDVVIPAPEIELVALSAGLITGRVIDQDGTPVSRAWIEAKGESGSQSIAADAQGVFAIPIAEPGSVWDVSAGRWGSHYPPVTVSGVVAGGQEATIRLLRAPSLRVRFVDDAGRPVAIESAVHVSVAHVDRDRESSFARGVGSDLVVLPGAPEGELTLFVQFYGDTEFIAPEPLTINSPSTDDILVVLRRGADIAGSVVDETGRAIGDVIVTCYPVGTRIREDDWPDAAMEAYTDEAGRFRVRGLEPGARYLVLAEGDAPHGLDLRRDVPTGASDVTLVIRRGREVSGLLVDASGEPVHDATILVRDDNTRLRAWAAIAYDGKFELHGVPDGPARISVRLPRPGPDIPLGLLAEDAKTIDLRLDILVPSDE